MHLGMQLPAYDEFLCIFGTPPSPLICLVAGVGSHCREDRVQIDLLSCSRDRLGLCEVGFKLQGKSNSFYALLTCVSMLIAQIDLLSWSRMFRLALCEVRFEFQTNNNRFYAL
jgi:hypothetical protein